MMIHRFFQSSSIVLDQTAGPRAVFVIAAQKNAIERAAAPRICSKTPRHHACPC